MATEIIISYGDHIVVDQSGADGGYHIDWADKGNSFPDIGNDIHYVIYNTAPGQDEVQRKDPSTSMMTGNTSLSSTSSTVGNSVTVEDLLNWGETRKGQIEQAKTDYATAVADDASNGTNNAEGKTWIDYDSNYS